MEIQQLVHNQAPWISRYVSHFVGYVKWGPVQIVPKLLTEFAERGGAAVWDFHVSDKVLSPTMRRAHPQGHGKA